eukprot:TRINITY_DN8081_c0_g1_i2.p1 TRINITY_DN8081_c0_g1~~TRINITY_DN8081_c0_g1_i2.p1  ORF type:complete len:146 (-),score=29.86 TRINITY_DN8081_c0_g1_i2:157-570(-)
MGDAKFMRVKYTMENSIHNKDKKLSIYNQTSSVSCCLKEVNAIKLLKAPFGLRRNSSLPDLFEGELGQNLKFRRNIHRDSDTSGDTIRTMDSQIINKENQGNISNVQKSMPEKKKRLSEIILPSNWFSTSLMNNLTE